MTACEFSHDQLPEKNFLKLLVAGMVAPRLAAASPCRIIDA